METEGTLGRRVSPFLILGGIFAVALFIRAFFVYELAIQDFLVSGGSDAFYFGWILDNIVTTGRHLLQDPMLNFPVGMLNPRPPIYAWSVALVGQVVGAFQGSVSAGVGQTFLFSTAVWGALTIFPTYFLAKEMFGRRPAYVAAFFLALLPAHIQRTPFSNGDHDALVLFFVVTAFYFLLKALAELKERSWVAAWWRPRAVVRGLGGLFTENRRTVLLAVMAGTALAVIALTWKGWAYAVVIIVVYFLAQILVHKIRNQDPLGILLVFAITLGVAHLLAAPYYVITGQVRTWFDVPLYLFLASLGLGLVFAIFHRLPWMLVVPPIILGFLAGTAIMAVYSPGVAAALSSGLGYFVPNKVFETIAEAQPPNLSQVILSFGAVTFYFSLAGIVLLALQFIRRPRPDFLFVLVWIVAAIFMALSAVRFLFNASPAFAITAAWVVILIVERLGLEQVRKAVATTGGSRLGALRRGVKIRHVAGVFLVAILVVLPNAWLAVDAGSPFEVKEDLEQQVLRVIPDFLRPPEADAGLFYFGAFGYTVPLPTRYFPQAWSWLRDQDRDVTPTWERPAFLSWWDYGFEAIQEARHPTVADNFQNGLEFAGHFLTSQSENEGIAVLNVRLLHGDLTANRGQFSPATEAVLLADGFDPDHVRDALTKPELFTPLIRAEPQRFGEWDTRLSRSNARIIYLRTIFAEALDLEAQAELYRDLQDATGTFIGYFAVDTRLIPFSGTNTGIFYAVVKLTDHKTAELPDGRSIPVDFYRLIAVTTGGEFPLEEVPPGAAIQDLRIEFKDAWYNSMLYRIFFGPDGNSVGVENDGLPGFSGALQSTTPRHGWMLEHFKMVYRTAYFNPHPPEDAANFTEEFTALNVIDALELERQIRAGEIEGTVDVSERTGLQNGIVILQYFDGAILRGRVTTESGTPLAGVRITALDEFLTPHAIRFTDERGFYEALLPFGENRVAVSSGAADNRTGVGTILLEEFFDISMAQARRVPVDGTGTGLPSFVVQRDFVVEGATIQGTAFLDLDGSGGRDPEEPLLPGLDVSVADILGGGPATGTVTGSDGTYAVGDLLPSRFRVSLARHGTELIGVNVTVGTGEQRGEDLAVPAATLSGSLTDEFGVPVAEATVQIVEETTGEITTARSGPNGTYRLGGLFAGTYSVFAEAGERRSLSQRLNLLAGTETPLDLGVEPQSELTGRTLLSFVPTPRVTLTLQRRGEANGLMVTSDAASRFAVDLPRGTYDLYALHFSAGRTYGFLGTVVMGPGNQEISLNMPPAHRIEGTVERQGTPVSEATVTFETAGGALHTVAVGNGGSFVTFLPTALYEAVVFNATGQLLTTLAVVGPTSVTFPLTTALPTPGQVFRDLNGNGTHDPGEGLPGMEVRITSDLTSAFSVLTGTEGTFAVPLVADVIYVWAIEEDGFEPKTVGPLRPGELGALAPIELVAVNVSVTGGLSTSQPLDLTGLNVTIIAIGHGGVSSNATTEAGGTWTALLQPGIYQLLVDDEGPSGDGSRRVQGEAAELRVPVGGGVEALSLPVVERVRVRGTISSGSPDEVDVLFDGPDRTFVPSDKEYLVYLEPGTYTVSGATDLPSPLALLTVLDLTGPADFNTTFQSAATLRGQLRVTGETVTPDLSIAFTRVADGARVVVPSAGSDGYSTILLPATYRVTAEWVGVDRLDGVSRFVRYTLDQTIVLTENGTADLLFARALDTRAVELRVLLGGQLTSARVAFQAANETAINATVDAPAGAPFLVDLAPGAYHVYAFRDIGNSAALAELDVLPDGSTTLALPLEQGYRIFGVAILSDGSRRTTQLGFRSSVGSASFTTDTQGGYEVYLPAGAYDLVALASRDEGGVAVDYRFEGGVDLGDSTLLNALLTRVNVRTLEVTWDSDQRALVAPGETFVYRITVTNTGNMADTFSFEGSPVDWVFSFRPSRVSLPFGTGTSAEVTVQITTPEDAKAPEGTLTVVARSTTDPSVVSLETMFVDVLQFRGLTLDVGEDPPIFEAEALSYQIEVMNDGNGEDTFDLILTNPEVLAAQGWRAELVFEGQTSPDNITGIVVPAGESRPVTLRLQAEGRVSASTATFLAFSGQDDEVESKLDVAVGFPSLQIPPDQLRVEGKRVRLGPPEFPILLYGALAAAAIGLTVLFLTYRRRRRRR